VPSISRVCGIGLQVCPVCNDTSQARHRFALHVEHHTTAFAPPKGQLWQSVKAAPGDELAYNSTNKER